MVSLVTIRLAIGAQFSQQVVRVSKGSILDQAGMRPGDVVTKVNGVRLASAAQIGAALDKGKALIEIRRSGTTLPLTIYCP